MKAKDLFVNQSSLTGESFPVEKTISPLKVKDASISEWNNYLFMGTSVVSGTSTALVVRTGRSNGIRQNRQETITKRVVTSEMLPMMIEDWLKITRAITEKYGKVNPEYQELLSPRQR